MEIRCTKCQHVGAAEVLPTADGVVLVCENCGHHNPLDIPGEKRKETAPTPAASPRPAPPRVEAADPKGAAWFRQDALEKLIPEPGPGPRCQKCAHRLAPEDQFCPRCGLSVREGERYERGFAPWDAPAPGKEAVHEQASLLWRALHENPTEENLTKFATFAKDEELLEYGVRQLRFFVVEHPEISGGRQFLEELASSFQARLIVAQAKAQVGADEFRETADRLKRGIIWTVVVVWGAIFLFFLSKLLE